MHFLLSWPSFRVFYYFLLEILRTFSKISLKKELQQSIRNYFDFFVIVSLNSQFQNKRKPLCEKTSIKKLPYWPTLDILFPKHIHMYFYSLRYKSLISKCEMFSFSLHILITTSHFQSWSHGKCSAWPQSHMPTLLLLLSLLLLLLFIYLFFVIRKKNL